MSGGNPGSLTATLMPNFATLIAPMALLVPFMAPQDDAAKLTPVPPTEDTEFSHEWLMMEGLNAVPVQQQIRIERRVVIRISPYRPSRRNMAADAPVRAPQKLEERKIGKCLKVDKIGTVRPTRDNRLLFYMRDQRLIAANLEKACSARDYYQGFYMEPSKDGKLCIERDKLQSRTGVKCELKRIRQLVPETT